MKRHFCSKCGVYDLEAHSDFDNYTHQEFCQG